MIATFSHFLIFLLPISYFAGKAVIDINMSLLALLVLVYSAMRKEWGWLKQSWVIALGVFWAYLVVRAGFSEHIDKAMKSALVWVRYPLFAIALTVFLKDQRTLRHFFYSLGGAVAFVLFNIFLQYFTGSDLFGNGYSTNIESIRLAAVTGSPNIGLHLAWFALPLMVAAMLLAQRAATPRTLKPLLIVAPIIIIIATYMTAERMATLTIGLGAGLMMCYFFLRGRKMVGLIGLSLLAMSLVAAYMSSETLRINAARTVAVINDFENTSYGKIMINGLGIFAENPVFGVGVREFRYHCAEGGFAVEDICKENGVNMFTHPHNIYIEILSELGAVGMVLFLAAVVLMVRHYFRAPREHYLNALLVACLLAAMLRLFPLASTPNFHINWSMAPFWMWMGVALALSQHRVTLFEENSD